MKAKVAVTQALIDAANAPTPQNIFRLTTTCPVARALWDATGFKWEVGYNTAVRSKDGLVIVLPKVAEKLSRDFTMSRPVEPVEFEVEIPD
jgi:hypothetical protein